MSQKTVLLVDDEQMFLEALEDALSFEGHRVLKARDVATALQLLRENEVHAITVDVMLSPGQGLENVIKPNDAGYHLCKQVRKDYPQLPAFCMSVVNDAALIKRIENLGVRFLRKGETPLRTVLNLLNERLEGRERGWRGNKDTIEAQLSFKRGQK